MRVVRGLPPVYDEIVAKLGKPRLNVVFAYGDVVYSQSGRPLPPDLAAHEAVHLHQQKSHGGPETWWRWYLDDPGFRLRQELAAYRAQIDTFRGRESRRGARRRAIRDLTSGMYGRIVTAERARELLA